MTTMIPFPEDAAMMAAGFLERQSYIPEIHQSVKPYRMDPLPPLNAKGGRTVPVGGWRTEYYFTVTHEMCNPMGNLHGGAAATLADTVSSASVAILSTESFWGIPMLSGVSITLDMQYYNAAPVDAKVRIVVTIEHLGGALGNMRIELNDFETGKRYASGTHVKTWRPLAGAKAKL